MTSTGILWALSQNVRVCTVSTIIWLKLYIEFTIGSYLFILLTKFIQITLFFLINGVLSHYPIPVTIASFAAFKNKDDNYLMVPEMCVRKLSPRTR